MKNLATMGAAGLACVFVLVGADARAVCVPIPLLQAIDQARSVRLVRLGTCPDERPVRRTGGAAEFLGCPRLGNDELPAAAVQGLAAVFAGRGSITCAEATGEPDWSEGATGTIGLEFDSDLGAVRMLLRLPGGELEVGRAGGAHYHARGSDAAAIRWLQFVAGLAGARQRPAKDMYAEWFAGQERPRPKVEPPVPLEIRTPEPLPPVGATDDTTCRTGGVYGEYDYMQELPDVVTRVEPVPPADVDSAVVFRAIVVVQALVCRDGRVHDVRIQKSVPGLDAAAIDAVRNWVFKPGRVNGRAIACWVAIPVKFTVH